MSDIAPVAVAIVFWLAVIVSLFVLLVQGLTILFRAILHAFVCTFTAVGTFIWLNVVSISSYLLTIAWRNLTNTLYFLSYPLAALFFDISSLTYENVFVNVIAGDKFEYFILARLGSCILLLSAVLAAFWFRNTLSGTFVSEIDEVEDDTNVTICSDYILDRCKRGNRCNNYHCPLPYQWQYQHLDEWKSFNAQDNCRMEEWFCDPSKNIVNAPEIEAALKSYPRDCVDDLNVLGYTTTIDFDDMLITLGPLESQDTHTSQLRRLSTFDGSVDRISMIWTWYWKKNDNDWRAYDKDCSERELQGVIEEAYLDYLKQGKVREEFRFETAEHVYNLLFCPTGMYQVNLKTRTMRGVRRRPAKFISNEDIEDLKRKRKRAKYRQPDWYKQKSGIDPSKTRSTNLITAAFLQITSILTETLWTNSRGLLSFAFARRYGDRSYKKEEDRQLRMEKKNFTRHWSPMPPKLDYIRAHVDRSSVEFKDLEKLFRTTMKDYKVRIENIDRVQNFYMMEKYCRKKEKMRQSEQTVDERALFHGTTPDAVEAICKRNFDWRLHGKNATSFGAGSYFARDASYSHCYADKNAHGFQHMFVAKVLVGSFIRGHANYRTPPRKIPSDPASDLYDSCVDNQSNPRIFVVFDTDQVYPEYIITYSAVSQFDLFQSFYRTRGNPNTTSMLSTSTNHDQLEQEENQQCIIC